MSLYEITSRKVPSSDRRDTVISSPRLFLSRRPGPHLPTNQYATLGIHLERPHAAVSPKAFPSMIHTTFVCLFVSVSAIYDSPSRRYLVACHDPCSLDPALNVIRTDYLVTRGSGFVFVFAQFAQLESMHLGFLNFNGRRWSESRIG